MAGIRNVTGAEPLIGLGGLTALLVGGVVVGFVDGCAVRDVEG